MRIKKRKPKKLKPYEIPIKLEITLIVPDKKEHVFRAKIEIPEYKIDEMIAEAI